MSKNNPNTDEILENILNLTQAEIGGLRKKKIVQ